MVLAVGAICPKPLSPEPVVRAGEEGPRDIPPPGMGPAGAREPCNMLDSCTMDTRKDSLLLALLLFVPYGRR